MEVIFLRNYKFSFKFANSQGKYKLFHEFKMKGRKIITTIEMEYNRVAFMQRTPWTI